MVGVVIPYGVDGYTCSIPVFVQTQSKEVCFISSVYFISSRKMHNPIITTADYSIFKEQTQMRVL